MNSSVPYIVTLFILFLKLVWDSQQNLSFSEVKEIVSIFCHFPSQTSLEKMEPKSSVKEFIFEVIEQVTVMWIRLAYTKYFGVVTLCGTVLVLL